MALGKSPLKMGIPTMVIFTMDYSVEKAHLLGLMALSILVNSLIIASLEKESTDGPMEAHMRDK